MPVRITGASVTSAEGVEVATIEAIKAGGGTEKRDIAGAPNDRSADIVYPVTDHFHVRLLSQAGNMIPDELILVDTYDEACAVAEAYAEKVDKNAGLIAEFKASMV